VLVPADLGTWVTFFPGRGSTLGFFCCRVRSRRRLSTANVSVLLARVLRLARRKKQKKPTPSAPLRRSVGLRDFFSFFRNIVSSPCGGVNTSTARFRRKTPRRRGNRAVLAPSPPRSGTFLSPAVSDPRRGGRCSANSPVVSFRVVPWTRVRTNVFTKKEKNYVDLPNAATWSASETLRFQYVHPPTRTHCLFIDSY